MNNFTADYFQSTIGDGKKYYLTTVDTEIDNLFVSVKSVDGDAITFTCLARGSYMFFDDVEYVNLEEITVNVFDVTEYTEHDDRGWTVENIRKHFQ